jgi:pyruvate kinase
MAKDVSAKAVITMTYSGYTAFRLASYRPKALIFAFTSNKAILNTLSLLWGVRAFYYDKEVSTDHTIADIKHRLKKEGFIDANDLIINIASIPMHEHGKANMIKLSLVD